MWLRLDIPFDALLYGYVPVLFVHSGVSYGLQLSQRYDLYVLEDDHTHTTYCYFQGNIISILMDWKSVYIED